MLWVYLLVTLWTGNVTALFYIVRLRKSCKRKQNWEFIYRFIFFMYKDSEILESMTVCMKSQRFTRRVSGYKEYDRTHRTRGP